MQLLLRKDNCVVAAPPGNDRSFSFLYAAQKEWSAMYEGNVEDVAALLGRVEGRWSTEERQFMLSFIGSMLLQSACGKCHQR